MSTLVQGNAGVNVSLVIRKTDINETNITSNPVSQVTVNDMLVLSSSNTPADQCYVADATIEHGSTLSINLTTSDNPLQDVVNFELIYSVYIANKNIVTDPYGGGYIEVGGSFSNENQFWFDNVSYIERLEAGEISFHNSPIGWSISGNDVLTIRNPTADDAKVSICIIGKTV